MGRSFTRLHVPRTRGDEPICREMFRPWGQAYAYYVPRTRGDEPFINSD